jgi:hypothetical protein
LTPTDESPPDLIRLVPTLAGRLLGTGFRLPVPSSAPHRFPPDTPAAELCEIFLVCPLPAGVADQPWRG